MLDGIRRVINNVFSRDKNKFNEAFIVDGGYTLYDPQQITYIEKGYQYNPLVYSIVNQMASKTACVPIYVKNIKDEQKAQQVKQLLTTTKGDLSLTQRLKLAKLTTKAYSEDEMPLPLEKPNVYQTWAEFLALYKTFIRCTGNVYLYMVSPEEGVNAGIPNQIYILPSQHIQIITKENPSVLDFESPVHSYILWYGKQYIEFEPENVIHIKYANPEYDQNGSHLYGQSPLRAALRNIQSSNVGLDLNIKTLKSGGAFGLIHGKNATLTKQQADSIKDRLLEMDNSTERLAKLAGVSAEVGFTRLSLTSDELKPFLYFDFDEKTIADCLNWEMITESRGDYGGTIKELRKQRVVDNIQPDLQLLEQALNDRFIKKFKGYEDAYIYFDVMELPEMQSDVKEVTEWLNNALDRGVINRNEYREAIRYMTVGDEAMDRYTVNMDVIGLDEALQNDFQLTQ